MAESKAAASRVPVDILPGEEITTIKIMQIDCDLDVPSSEVQPQRIIINPKLLQAARLGDKNILDKLLQSENISLRASVGEIAIVVPENAATQNGTKCLLGVTREGNTALHIAASRGHLELAKEICCRERSLLMAPNTMLNTPLHCAARVGDDKMVSLIIQFAKEDEIELRRVLMARSWDEANALHEAAKYDHVQVAKVLIEEDADLASMLNDAGMSPLYLAIVMGSLNVAKALLQSSSWKKDSLACYAGFGKQTALHVVICISQEITEDILQREPTLAKVADHLGRLPLHYAASGGHPDMAKLLLERDHSAAYESDADGFFPIHIAAMMGNIPVIDEILEQCPDTDELLDEQGKNFLHIAFQWRELNVVKKIVSKRPDLRKLLNDQDKKGNTPLHTAVENQDQWSVYFLLRDKTVNINVINHDGLTPLDLAHAKLDRGRFFNSNVANSILSSLAFTKALPGPSSKFQSLKKVASSLVDEVKDNPPSDENKKKPSDEQMKRWQNIPRNLTITSVLIATVTFAAGFTVPGGYIADDHPGYGTAVLAKEYAFQVFLVSDGFAFVCSIVATYWLMFGGTTAVDESTRWRILTYVFYFLWLAFSGICTAFAMGIYATLDHRYKSIGIFLCIISLGTPVLAIVVIVYNDYNARKTIMIRQGYRYGIWPTTIYWHVETSLHLVVLRRSGFIYLMLRVWGSYAIFFLLPKLLWVSKN